MASSLIVQVIILCAIFSLPSITTAAKEEAASGFGYIPGLAILKDVDIWKDGEITSLGKTFGPDPAEWCGDLHVVADMSSTALCCLYSSAMVGFIRKIENDFLDCNKSVNDARTNSIEGYSVLKSELKSLQPIVLEILTTALNYTKISSNIRVDKNVLNAIMSSYLFLYNIKDGKYSSRDRLSYNFNKAKLYTRYLIEEFAVLNCSWSAFDLDGLNDRIDGFTIVSELNLPETHFKPDDLNPKNQVMPKVLNIRLDRDYNSLMSTLAYMHVDYDHGGMYLRAVAKRFREDYRSEIITQSQTIVFQCIASIVFYLINKIIEASAKIRTTLNSLTEMCVTAALNILKDFNFPGLLHVKLRKVLYQRTINSHTPFNYLFEGSQCHIHTIEDIIINTESTNSVEALTNMLYQFSNDLAAQERDIKTAIEINQLLCDYEYEEVGFLQYDTTTFNIVDSSYSEVIRGGQAVPILKRLKEKNCQFSYVVVVHFKLIDYIILQCEVILSGSNSLDTAKKLKSCFNSTVRSITLIEGTLDNSLVATLDILKSTSPHNNANRKVIDACLAMKLYLSNDTVLNSRAPQTEQSSVNVDEFIRKFDMLKRYNRFIINLIEHYTVHNCSTPSPREKFTNETSVKIEQQCGSFSRQNDQTHLVECVNGIIKDNLRTYEPVVAQIQSNDYTIGKLLMNNVLQKTSNEDNGLSMLHKLSIVWEGEHKTFTEIIDIVKNTVNPKYLCKYQLFMIKAIVFVVYEKMKIIIQSSAFGDNFQLYCSSVYVMLNALNVINSDFFPLGTFRIYQTIVDHFKMYFQRNSPIDKNAFIRIIEAEQYYLGVRKDSSGTTVNEIVHSLPDHTLRTSSKSDDDVEEVESPGLEKDGQYNVDQLLSYMAVVEDIRTEITNVALVLDLKQMSSLQI